MNSTLNPSLIQEFEVAFEEHYMQVLVNPDRKIIICKLMADYIPIDDFKLSFEKIGELVKEGNFEKFIFDKRSLRAFHQPTMEWYFIYWKKEMLDYGLSVHRKILPAEKWFEKMVQIAKDQILQNYPENVISKLDIKYCDTIDEAIVS
ncbi:hypothetical protein DFQ04_0129 [Algoriphagus boseongensis]|uniref:SpoIIAA-like protein n=1 Tax=Algoriphagus boseongensis TaxID=1442587 RepID=A0A4R6T5Y1_9BACT|nr:hypothetical protein [Algoriphagus boseongensis]TDQ18330.1 hypothetical protein DFQ04_0129 [Algoriphagus boseongensis]